MGLGTMEKVSQQEETSQSFLGDLARWADLVAPTGKTTKYKLQHHALTWRWKTAVKRSALPPGPRAMALFLADYVSNRTGVGWPTQETLANDMRRSRRAVGQWLGELEHLGWIEVDRSPRGSHRPNRYTLTFPGDVVDPPRPPVRSRESYSRRPANVH